LAKIVDGLLTGAESMREMSRERVGRRVVRIMVANEETMVIFFAEKGWCWYEYWMLEILIARSSPRT